MTIVRVSVRVQCCPIIFLEKREAVFCISYLPKYRASPVNFWRRKKHTAWFLSFRPPSYNIVFLKGSKRIRTPLFKIYFLTHFMFCGLLNILFSASTVTPPSTLMPVIFCCPGQLTASLHNMISPDIMKLT